MIKKLKKWLFVFCVGLLLALGTTHHLNPNQVFANSGCLRVGQCINNKRCECSVEGSWYACRIPSNLYLGDQDCGSAIIGGVTAPFGVQEYTSESGGAIGIMLFLSRLINLAAIVAGMIVFVNLLLAGFMYITSAGDTGTHQKVREKVTWSVLGILVIVVAYTLAGLIGLIFFGDPAFILRPELRGALS
jgi:hypothetical protein